jgi:hypothetical protein
MVEVFKTNVGRQVEARLIIQRLIKCFPGYKINFDLKDCDKILRVEGDNIAACRIIELLQAHNFYCVPLE